jgi:hypothetical protein
MEQVKGRSRRRHDADLKAHLLAECAESGASVAQLASCAWLAPSRPRTTLHRCSSQLENLVPNRPRDRATPIQLQVPVCIGMTEGTCAHPSNLGTWIAREHVVQDVQCNTVRATMISIGDLTKLLEYVKEKGWRSVLAIIAALVISIYVAGFVVGCLSEVF